MAACWRFWWSSAFPLMHAINACAVSSGPGSCIQRPPGIHPYRPCSWGDRHPRCWLQVLETLQSCDTRFGALGSIYPSTAVQEVCSAAGVNPCHVCYCQGLAQVGRLAAVWCLHLVAATLILSFYEVCLAGPQRLALWGRHVSCFHSLGFNGLPAPQKGVLCRHKPMPHWIPWQCRSSVVHMC
jgi:hypothetical protein